MGKYPLSELTNPESIEKIIKEEYPLWVIAVDGGKVVGSTLGMADNDNNSIEFGGGVLDENYRGQHLATKGSLIFFQKAIGREYDIIWGSPRRIQVKTACEGLGMHTVGYLPGAHFVDFSELHLIALMLTEKAKSKRVSPSGSRGNVIYNLPLTKRIIGEMELDNSCEDDYPSGLGYGGSRTKEKKENIPGQRITIDCTYRKGDNAVLMRPPPESVCYNARYLEVNLPTSNTEGARFFRRLGFEVCAFLPGWYGKEKRYDAVKLARCFENTKTVDEEVGRIIEQLKEEARIPENQIRPPSLQYEGENEHMYVI